jgi:4-amino-4-deoxy-L-arabinose transferase-like glycosyltransferase
MHEKVKAAPIGAFSLLAIGLTTACFPLIGFLGTGQKEIAVAVMIVSSASFSPALVCSVYSIVFEKFKLFGLAGLVLAALTLLIVRETLYFLEMGLFLGPCTVLVMMMLAKWRRKKNRDQIPQANG